MTDPKAVDMAGPGDELPHHPEPLPCRSCGYAPATLADAINHAFEAHIKPLWLDPARRSRLSRLLRRLGMGR